jgi:hypothetical protein
MLTEDVGARFWPLKMGENKLALVHPPQISMYFIKIRALSVAPSPYANGGLL